MESSEREVQTARQWSERGPSTMTEGELLLNTRGTGFKENIFGSLFSLIFAQILKYGELNQKI